MRSGVQRGRLDDFNDDAELGLRYVTRVSASSPEITMNSQGVVNVNEKAGRQDI